MSLHKDFAHLQIPLQDILSATKNFADDHIIGQSGFGRVYKGKLLMEGQHIDIVARRLDPGNGRVTKAFTTEISMLSSLKHPNIVCIVGFCDENDEKIVINKYEARGDLFDHLDDPTLTWLQRLQICYHVALALSYIHYDVGRDFSVIHRNIASTEIMLSDDWEPRLSGFGFSITDTTGQRNRLLCDDYFICGTTGYIDPTYEETGFVSHKSDVYSFGVVLFEVLCGRPGIATLAKSHFEEGTLYKMIHPNLREQKDPHSFSIFSETAYACLNEEPSQRPDADQIVKRLEEALQFQRKQETPERSIIDLEVEDALLKERSIIDLEVKDASLKGSYLKHLKIPLADIQFATNNFSKRNLIGSGGYAMVYKGKLPNTENNVAIKLIMHRADMYGEQGFFAEAETLSKCKHPNIISLIGFCHEDPHMILVYEYASKGSLDDLLAYNDHTNSFTWDQRIQICLDIAHGLRYLHTGIDDKHVIIHRDIKSANILLDENGKAKITDFGLSKLRSSYKKPTTLNTNSNSPNSFVRALHASKEHEELHVISPTFSNIVLSNYSKIAPSYRDIPTSFASVAPGNTYVPRGHNSILPNYSNILRSTFITNNLAGTLVYLDPEYMKTGRLKKQSDIYSFGVVLFEVLCGRLAYDVIYTADSETGLASIARRRFKEGNIEEMIDPKLKNIVDGNISMRNKALFYQKSLDTFARIAHQCVAETQAKRPRIEVVIKELEKSLHLLTSGKFADLQIPLEDLLLATNNFHEENFIGKSTSEDFYKGLLIRSEKRINVVARRFNGKEIEFWTEISMLSSLKHKNLVSLAGFCLEKSEKIIIYDNVVRGSLDQLLLSDPKFTWPQRLKVCLCVAKALKDIHYDVIHCDINSSKIFVDKDWEAKVFGFELSTEYPETWMHRLLFSHYFNTSSTYKDPVYVKTKSVMPKYDVYSFGVILFEVLYGRRAIMTKDGGVIPSLAENAMAHYKEGKLDQMIDFDLRKQMDSQSLKIFLETACHCLEEHVRRPTMDKVFRKLEDASELQWEHDIQVPSKPVDEATSSNNLKEKMVIPLDKIIAATYDFKPELAVGRGGFGLVFRAELNRSDIPSLSSMKGENESLTITVAVKQIFSRADDKGEKGYLAEIELLTSCKHKNIVSLLGYCRQDEEMILVYEYAFKGSLGDYFCKPPKRSTNLTWVQRIKICLDIARGLQYLHTDMDGKPRIIHRDIKSDNILLDEEMNAKIADFGLSKAQPKNQETFQTHYAVGTSVYTDPEFVITNKYKKESDTYSFGVVLFEMLSGTLAYDQVYLDENKNGLAHIARRRFIEGTLKELIDPKIIEEDEDHIFTLNRGPNQDSFDTFSKIAFKCLAETQANRPTIDVVIDELQRALKIQGETLVLTRFQLNDIELAIKSSTETNSIGSDASGGIVYKAKLHFVSKSSLPLEKKEPINVAIKRISSREDGKGDQQGFFEEIDVLTRYKHGNIVSLLGFCDEGREMHLVFEDASNGSIDDYLRKTYNKANLTWGERLQWCLDIARGLNHLHTKMGSEQGIIHGDIKSANILIGKNSEPKIAYYGLSKSHKENQVASDTNNSVGTDVYLDPEYEKTRTLDKKSDVFSFGVVLFELFCGRLAYDLKYKEENDKGLAPIARQGFNDMTIRKMIDPELKVENDGDIFTSNRGPNQDSLNQFLDIAIKCLEETPANRPTMGVAIQKLEKALRFQENLTTRLQISFEDIKSWTHNFSNNVGSGEYWKAYKGEINLPLAQINAKFVSNASVFAKRWDSTFAQGRQQFLNELKILLRYKHTNIIGVAGYCDKDDEKIIVYEHASKGSLDKSLDTVDLTWMKRLEICIGVASALEFLHGGAIMLENVVHSNIRSSNILLTGDWKAKICNMELSAVHAYDQDMKHVINYANGSLSYLAPEHKQGSLTSESDIYSFGVVLFEILCGRLAWQEGSEGSNQSLVTLVINRYKEGKLDEMVFEHIRGQPVTESLETFQGIALKCLHDEKNKRPEASEVVIQLKKALEFQEDHDIWKPKLPSNYKEIIDMSKDPHQLYSIKKKDLYEKLITEGIFLEEEAVVMSNMKKDFNKKKNLNKKKKLLESQHEGTLHEGKVWFSLPRNAKEGNTLISATTFSYGNLRSHKWRSIQKSTARFDTVAKMTDISDLQIQIKLNTSFLAVDVDYGVYLVFKFCDQRKFSGKLMYVNLKYKKGSETLHAYFATRRDDAGWMTVGLDRFRKQEEDTDFEVSLESFPRCYCGSGAIYVQGIEFQAIDNKKDDKIQKLKGVQQVRKLINDYDREELSCEVDGKKQLMISAGKVLFNPEDIKHFESKPSAESRFQYVMELPRRQVFRIKYKIDSKMLSPFTEYTCYLVFKLSEKCCGLHCPVKVQDLLHRIDLLHRKDKRDIHHRKKEDTKILYFRSPASIWNQHNAIWVPEQRKDGWMEVTVWRFNSRQKLRSTDHIPMNLKLITYEGTMSGLIVCGLEFRPTT